MSYTSNERRFERHVTKSGRTYRINQHGKAIFDPIPPQENGWVVAAVAIAFTLFAIIFAAAQ